MYCKSLISSSDWSKKSLLFLITYKGKRGEEKGTEREERKGKKRKLGEGKGRKERKGRERKGSVDVER